MQSEIWQVFRMQQFKDDLLHFQTAEDQVQRWSANLVRLPLMGEPIVGSNLPGLLRYDVGAYWLDYVVVPEAEKIWLMCLRDKRDDPSPLPKRLIDAAKLLRNALQTVIGLKGD